jgi:glycosyltransferase involved in cell wall biosynthesis
MSAEVLRSADYIRRMAAPPTVSPTAPPPSRTPFSVVIITLNAATQLGACLDSVAFADDIVVLDSGSTDGTRELATSHGARVVEGPWLGYGPQKNRAVGLARHEWVLCLDADERVTPALRASIESALAAAVRDRQAWRMARANRFMGRVLRHGEGYPDWSLRLFDRGHARWSEDPVHEKVLVDGTVGTLEGDLMHESAETLEAYLAKQNRYTTLQAEALAARGERASWSRLALSPLLRFVKFYLLRRGFMDGVPGLVHISIGCFNSLMKYAKLRALTRP